MAPTIRGSNPLDHIKRDPLDDSSPLADYLATLSSADRKAIEHPMFQSKRSPNNLTPRQFIQSSQPSSSSTPSPSSTLTFNHKGAIAPNQINNVGVQAVFAIIACSFVIAIIWFFFIAKNGGFVFKEGDWEEYKSTVLRRKGPNGTTLSNATKSTKLGGGSVVGSGFSDQDSYRDNATVYTGTMSELSSSSTAPILQEKRNRRQTTKEKTQRAMATAEFEGGHDRDVRAYMREKSARVGGMNTTSDSLHYGTDYTESEPPISYAASQVSAASQQHDHTSPINERAQRARSPPKREFSYTLQPTEASFVSPPRPSRYRPSPNVDVHIARPAPAARETYTIGGKVPGAYPQVYAPTARESMTQPLRFAGQTQPRSYTRPLDMQARGYRRGMGELDD